MARSVVLLHGFTHTGASWTPVVAALGERYRAIAPDIRGHGTAAAHAPVSLEAVIADLDGLVPEQSALVGYSMGGRIALHAAMALGDRVKRLVLIGASPGIEDSSERDARRAADETLAGEIERSRIEEFAERWSQIPVLAGQSARVLADAHTDRLRNTPAGLAAALRGLGTGTLPSLWGRLAEVAIPVTIVVGEHDLKFLAVAERMAAALRDGEVVVVPGVGHAVHLEAPAELAEILRSCA